MKLIISDSNNPVYNISLEEYIFKHLPIEEESYVYFWINSPAVIIGTNQDANQEVNLDFTRENNIHVIRRITGGGAVYHDLGNINFSFITKANADNQIDFKYYYLPIVNALKAIGIDAELSGRNDITIDGKKCIGSSQSIYKKRVLSNGCILFDVDTSVLSDALKVNKKKLASKGIKSVHSRVTNIKPYLREDVSTKEFVDILADQVFKQFQEEPSFYKLSEEDQAGVKKIMEERFGNDEWNLGQSPTGKYENEERLSAGMVKVNFDVKNHRFTNVKITGDFFGKENIADIEKLIENTPYDKLAVEEKLQALDLNSYLSGVNQEEFIDFLFQ